MKQAYLQHRFSRKSSELLDFLEAILAEYETDSLQLTLRQLYYQCVARGRLANTERNYKQLGELVSRGRLAGRLDWDMLIDRTRELHRVSHWESPQDIVLTAAESYRLDSRVDQDCHIEVWVEKDALAGIVLPVAKEQDVHCLVCRGFVSQSAVYAAQARLSREDRPRRILYLGDHDPSGLDMTRDISDRLNLTFGVEVDVERIALTWAQIEAYQPPPYPAKVTDSRYADYVSEYGPECWELDALDPRTLAGIVRTRIEALTDSRKRAKWVRVERRDRDRIRKAASILQRGEI